MSPEPEITGIVGAIVAINKMFNKALSGAPNLPVGGKDGGSSSNSAPAQNNLHVPVLAESLIGQTSSAKTVTQSGEARESMSDKPGIECRDSRGVQNSSEPDESDECEMPCPNPNCDDGVINNLYEPYDCPACAGTGRVEIPIIKDKLVKLPPDWQEAHNYPYPWAKDITKGVVWGRVWDQPNRIVVTLLRPDGTPTGQSVNFDSWELIPL